MKFITQLCSYCRLVKAISDEKSTFFYYTLIIFAILYILAIIGLFIYLHFAQATDQDGQKKYIESVVAFLRYQILLLVWVFYLPFFEVFISVLKCSGGKHYIDT